MKKPIIIGDEMGITLVVFFPISTWVCMFLWIIFALLQGKEDSANNHERWVSTCLSADRAEINHG